MPKNKNNVWTYVAIALLVLIIVPLFGADIVIDSVLALVTIIALLKREAII